MAINYAVDECVNGVRMNFFINKGFAEFKPLCDNSRNIQDDLSSSVGCSKTSH